jgi:hypothetical protein
MEDALYELTIRAKWMFDDCETIDQMIERLDQQKEYLGRLKAKGIEPRSPVKDDYAFFETEDPAIAEEFGFQEEPDFDEDEDDATQP